MDDWLRARLSSSSVAFDVFQSATRLKKDPDAKPAGFQYTALASSATAVNAPAIPAARVPAASGVWAHRGAPANRTRRRLEMKRLRRACIRSSLAYPRAGTGPTASP